MGEENRKLIKVVHINTPYQIVINSGSNDGLIEGNKFIIYGLGPEMNDPDTGEFIENLEIIRGYGRITHIQNKIATLDSTMTEEKPRTTRRISQSPVKLFGPYNNNSTEEVEIIKEKKPFNDVQIGDRARMT